MRSPGGLAVLMVFTALAVFGPAVPGPLEAQERTATATASTGDPPPGDAGREPPAVATLRSILLSIESVQRQIDQKKSLLASTATPDEKARLLDELRELDQRLAALRRDFQSVATGIEWEELSAEGAAAFDLKAELDQLLGPIAAELRGLTEKPREIEELRRALEAYRAREAMIEKALLNLKMLLAATKDETVRAALLDTGNQWAERQRQTENRIRVTQYRLEERLKDRKSFFEAAADALARFFRTRGKNLILSLGAFILVFLGLRYLHGYVHRFSPFHRRGRKTFYTRLGDVIYYAGTFVGALMAALLVLYSTGDWVLMGVAIVLLIGLILAARSGIPRFYEQARLLLNLGEVREGERMVHAGVPWRVSSLSFYTTLENPSLTGGRMRLPLRKLGDFLTRPLHKDELWFPCEQGDWVILSDGTRGRVLLQTPEMVQLVLLGGSRKTYQTAEFLTLSPDNISAGFRLKSIFGVDYRHQAGITDAIPDKLWERIMRELMKLIERDDLHSLKVEFKEAGPSSLDLEIIADFDGCVAAKYEVLSRALQRSAVRACNEHGWVIPFTQLTLHQAIPGEGRAMEEAL